MIPNANQFGGGAVKGAAPLTIYPASTNNVPANAGKNKGPVTGTGFATGTRYTPAPDLPKSTKMLDTAKLKPVTGTGTSRSGLPKNTGMGNATSTPSYPKPKP